MPKKILVVDDDEGILQGFQAMLESFGYDAAICSNADCLFSFVSKHYPDLILLDVLLSGEDGRDLCKRLKAEEKTRHIPVVMMSAAPEMETSVKEACADGFLKKPFEMDEVLETITRFTGNND